MRNRALFLCVALIVFIASPCFGDDKRLIAEQQNVVKETEVSRAAAAKSAEEWEAHIEKLNSEVIPDDHFSHDVPKVHSKIAHKHAIHRMLAKSVAKHLKPSSEKHPVKVSQHHGAWHQQTASELLAHDSKIAAESTPSEPKQSISAFHDTAEAMYARRKAEVDAAFPSSWMSASKKQAQKPKKAALSEGDKKWAQEVAYRQKAMNMYQANRNKVKEMKEEIETHMERSQASQQAAKELTHLSAISEEVWPKHDAASKTKIAAVQKRIAAHGAVHKASTKSIAAPHAPQQRPHDWRSGSPVTGHSSRSVPMSSDSTIPSVGTDVAYIGAHQAGYVRKPHPASAASASSAHQPVREETQYPYGTVAKPLQKSAKAASQSQRDVKAEHSAHRQAASVAIAAKAPTAKPAASPAKAARAMPESSDAAVPEMGTNVVFEGASAVSRFFSRLKEQTADAELVSASRVKSAVRMYVGARSAHGRLRRAVGERRRGLPGGDGLSSPGSGTPRTHRGLSQIPHSGAKGLAPASRAAHVADFMWTLYCQAAAAAAAETASEDSRGSPPLLALPEFRRLG